MLEKVLITQFFASELAEALAPALAEQLAPRLLKSMEDMMGDGSAAKKQTTAARSGGPGRKPEPK
jgi:hypothetical protein